MPMAKRFPTTRLSAVEALKDPDQESRTRAYDTILNCYWKPAYKYIRLKWNASPDDAEDLTQGFFAIAFEKKYLERYDVEQARFSAFLRVCIDRFIANQLKFTRRVKRHPVGQLPLDFDSAESEIALNKTAADLSMEEFFEREWVRSLVERSITDLKRECISQHKPVHFSLFKRYNLDETFGDDTVSYKTLANEFGLSTVTVTNYLASVRRDFRRILLQNLRDITASASEYRQEARRLFGMEL
jgi:DNA-directed RNA polymerase specialized sigma24 family protein